MNETYLSIADARQCVKTNPTCEFATGHTWSEKTLSFVPLNSDNIPDANGAGGVISNVYDYSKWVRALMYESGPVSKNGHQALKSPHSISSPLGKKPYSGPEWYGFGLSGSIYSGEKIYEHNGGLSGFVSKIAFLPDKQWGVVTLQNAANFAQDVVFWQLVDDFLGTPKSERVDMNKE